ncbi:MAG: hypothetical protein DMG70_22125 [Acidobacteria bacterium]|nr:MAG: hypothetical protein DMG70_22125 [Acidobacteriota bacterium]
MTPAATISNSALEGSWGPSLGAEFPKGFLWGVSTAAHQVEAENKDNQWYDWEAAGRIESGERCGLACDWWNNAERDFDLARDLGLNALRLSVEWRALSRNQGNGTEKHCSDTGRCCKTFSNAAFN